MSSYWRGVEGDLGFGKEFAFAGGGVDAIDGGRLNVGLEAEESVAIGGSARDAGGGADALVVDGAGGFAVERVDAGFGLHIVEALDVDFAADDGEVSMTSLPSGTMVFHASGMMPGSARRMRPLGEL